MFEVGKRYTFTMVDFEPDVGSIQQEISGIVERYDHPLVKLQDSHVEASDFDTTAFTIIGQIINVTSHHFVMAVKDGDNSADGSA